MDQVKEYLQVALKYRFWILMGIAAILPVIAYFASAGDLQAQTEAKINQIKGSYEAANKFASNSAPVNAQYKPLVESKTKVLRKDVNASWRKLYARQAPLMTWPSAVAAQMNEWGRKWPAELAPNAVYQTISNYVETYDDYVKEVYASFKPFDYETGQGIIVAPPAEMLLAAPTFSITKPPSLGKVWDAQQRLWVQRTVLDVLAKVNEKAGAKDWQTAPVKQVLSLAVATARAQDQKSIAQGEALTKTEDVVQPGTEVVADEAGAPAGEGSMGGKAGMMGDMAAMRGGMGGGGGMGMGAQASNDFEILPSKNPNQAFIVPVHLSVYVEQERIPDLLVEFKNSPMNIEVLDFAMYKPEPHSVKKPKKGQAPTSGMGGMMGGMGGMMGGAGGMMDDMMTGGYGASSAGYGGMRGGMAGAGAGGYGAASGGYGAARGGMAGAGAGGYGGGGSYGGMVGGGPAGGATQKKTGVDIRQEQLQKREQAKEKAKKGEEGKDDSEGTEEKSATDPYYNVVRIDIYGKARFYLPPPKEEPADEETTSPGADAATNDSAPKADAEAPKAEGDEPKTEAPKAEGEAPKAEEPKDGEPAPKPDADAPTPAEGDQPAAPAPAEGDQPAAPAPEGKPADAPPAGEPKSEGTGSEAPKAGR